VGLNVKNEEAKIDKIMQVLAPLYKKLPLESSNKRIDAIL
jgi:hypothetical protein